jgi:hypothetical protein
VHDGRVVQERLLQPLSPPGRRQAFFEPLLEGMLRFEAAELALQLQRQRLQRQRRHNIHKHKQKTRVEEQWKQTRKTNEHAHEKNLTGGLQTERKEKKT